jgi:hypothetical protein
MRAKERVKGFVLLRHTAMLATTKAGIETIGRPANLRLYQFAVSPFSLCRLSSSSTAVPLLCVRACVRVCGCISL